MKRLIKYECGTIDDLNTRKYILQKEYNGFGVYQEKCPSGYYVHQSWLITNEKVALVCHSFSELCKEELLDMIDSYQDTGKFGIRAFYNGKINDLETFTAHQNRGKMM